MYNTQLKSIVVREYGRNAQELILHSLTIEDRAERQQYIERVVNLIVSMNFSNKNNSDFRLKLWFHIIEICEGKLDVDFPAGIPDIPKNINPEPLKYPNLNRKLRHYGQHVKQLIKKAKLLEDVEKRDAFVNYILSYMKFSYLKWNRDSANDEVILDEFRLLAGEGLELPEKPNTNLLTGNRRQKSYSKGKNNTRHRVPPKAKRRPNYKRQ
jgi:hypothetical protein